MTSPNLKRPLDSEMANHPVKIARRCTNYLPQPKDSLSAYSSSVFKDPSSILPPLSDEVALMIKDELHRNNNHDNHEQPVLTIRQTQLCVEKLIKDREQKLREEYDKALRTKLAEHTTELLNKINYLNNPYLEPSRMPTAPNLTQQASNHPSMNALAAAYRSAAAVAAAANTAAAAAASSLPDPLTFAAQIGANGHPGALTPSHLAYNLQQQAAAAIQAQNQRITTGSTIQSGPVLLASNLDEQLATPEALFTLFGVFGDVIRVKILFNKKDNALIQMADANQAQVAQGYLDKQKIFGKIIRVTRSKHQLVQMPREGNQSDAGLTKDFTNSPLHRFKIPGSRNYLNIYPPSNTLHISNIPATIDENDINKAFKEACGFEFSSFKFFPKDRKMALMKFNSIEHATIALIKMHNSPITEDTNLRVSFSKSIMQQ